MIKQNSMPRNVFFSWSGSVSNAIGRVSLITDAYSRKIMGYGFREDLSAEGCIDALSMALSQRSNEQAARSIIPTEEFNTAAKNMSIC